MGVPMPVAGLRQVLSEIPDGRLVVLDGGVAVAKGFLARDFVRQGAESSRPVTLVDSDAGHTDLELAYAAARAGQDCVVDSFALLAAGLPAREVATQVRQLRGHCRASGSVAVITLHKGLMENAAEAVVHTMADGLLTFHEREDTDGVVRFLRVPKWMGTGGSLRNIYYDCDGRRMDIDTRRRVN